MNVASKKDTTFAVILILARKLLNVKAMTTFETLYQKMAALEQSVRESASKSQKADATQHVSRSVAHELNNLLTVIQGHADRLLLQNDEQPALAPYLRVISEAAKRATVIIRDAKPSASATFQQKTPLQPQATL